VRYKNIFCDAYKTGASQNYLSPIASFLPVSPHYSSALADSQICKSEATGEEWLSPCFAEAQRNTNIVCDASACNVLSSSALCLNRLRSRQPYGIVDGTRPCLAPCISARSDVCTDNSLRRQGVAPYTLDDALLRTHLGPLRAPRRSCRRMQCVSHNATKCGHNSASGPATTSMVLNGIL
jgi:hypothetical protein